MTQQDYVLQGHDPLIPTEIVFKSPPTKEIAKFAEEGFYYKGEFVDDAGEVHRLMKDVLNGMCYKQLCTELLAALEEEASNWNLEPEDHPLVERARAALNT